MIKKFEVDELLKKNPQINPEALEQSIQMRSELERLGHKKPGYQLERRGVKVFAEKKDGEVRRAKRLTTK